MAQEMVLQVIGGELEKFCRIIAWPEAPS